MATGDMETNPQKLAQPVWLDMDQQALNDAYDQTIWAPYAERLAQRRDEACREALVRLGAPTTLAYGDGERENLALYRHPGPKAPIFVFVHGGAWRSGSAARSIFAAENILDAGAHFIAVDFVDVVAAGGDLRKMVDQVRRAIAWIHGHAAEFGGDPDRLVLCSHSSGSHLSGCALTTDWRALGTSGRPVCAALLSSGMYELAPVRLSHRSRYVAFTDEIVADLSALRHLDKIDVPLILSYGTQESPEFQRQTRAMHEALLATGKSADLRVGLGLDHFEVQETLGNPFGHLGRAARDLIAGRFPG